MMDPNPESPMPAKKWVPRPMTHTCGVCGAPAADVCHYGSTSCYSCRAFFRRSIGIGKEFVKCARGTGSCVIDEVNRTNCKKCRFEKCLQNGMQPEKVGKSRTNGKKMIKADHKTNDSSTGWLLPLTPESICSSPSTSSSEDPLKPQEENEIVKDERDEVKIDESEDMQNIVDISDLAERIVLDEFHQLEHSKLNKRAHFESETISRESFCSTRTSVICEVKKSNTGPIVDISDLAENCIWNVLDQFEIPKDMEISNIETEPNTNTYFPLANLMNPILELTLEEEFKIHELDAMKENLLDSCFKTLDREIPDFQKHISSQLISISQGFFPTKETVFLMQKKIKHVVINNLFNGGEICKFLDCYTIFKDVPEEVKLETLKFSFAVTNLCFRAFFKVNSNKEYFIEQKRAAGMLSPTVEQLLEQIQNDNRFYLKSVDYYAPKIFDSPWANEASDEDMFNHTMKTVGEIVKDDVKLGTLYTTLILATPGEELSHMAKSNPVLTAVQQEITLLIYRYLKNKYNDADRATNTLNILLKLIGDLHTCRAIHLFRRIQQTGLEQVCMSDSIKNISNSANMQTTLNYMQY